MHIVVLFYKYFLVLSLTIILIFVNQNILILQNKYYKIKQMIKVNL